jgi:hypothetical protein
MVRKRSANRADRTTRIASDMKTGRKNAGKKMQEMETGIAKQRHPANL